ncbi:MAG TPA: hypothetical protein VFS21_17410 [Roseiflexaceae bacterium]|nr:hypothetical protein [Roseiflexaceae bacterium]
MQGRSGLAVVGVLTLLLAALVIFGYYGAPDPAPLWVRAAAALLGVLLLLAVVLNLRRE